MNARLRALGERFKAMANPSQRTFRIVVVSLGVLALAWQQIEATRLGYEVERSRARVHEMQGQLGSLQMNLQMSLSPAQLAYQARTKLGMQPASPECLRLLGSPGSPAAADSFLSRLFSRISWRSLTAGTAT